MTSVEVDSSTSPQISVDYQVKVLSEDIQSLKQRCSSLSDEAVKRSKYYTVWSVLGKIIVFLFSFTITTISANGSIGDKSWIILSLSSTITLIHSLMMYLPSESSATKMREYSNQLLGISRRASSLRILLNPINVSVDAIDDMHGEVDSLSVKIYDMSPTQDISQVKRTSLILTQSRAIPIGEEGRSSSLQRNSRVREIRSTQKRIKDEYKVGDIEMTKIDISPFPGEEVVYDMNRDGATGEDEKQNRSKDKSLSVVMYDHGDNFDHVSEIIDPPSTHREENVTPDGDKR